MRLNYFNTKHSLNEAPEGFVFGTGLQSLYVFLKSTGAKRNPKYFTHSERTNGAFTMCQALC